MGGDKNGYNSFYYNWIMYRIRYSIHGTYSFNNVPKWGMGMIDELKKVWDYDPILLDWQAIFIFAFLVIYASLALYVFMNHGHSFSMGTETYFSVGYQANPGMGEGLRVFLYG